jgi:hypothetical protein
LNYQINVGYFNGLKTGATFAQSLWGANRAVEWVKQQKPNAKIWFGTRLSWMNCAFGIQSQKNTPMWWHPGTAFPKGDTEKYWQLWRDTQYDALITYGADKTWLDDEQLHDITNLYTPNKSLGPIWVWTRSNPAK